MAASFPACSKYIRRETPQALSNSEQPGLLGPPTVIVHGVEATGKSLTINAILGVLNTPSAVIKSQECITARHLLERALTATSESLSSHGPSQDIDGRCENISAFVVQLQHLLPNQQKFILVFDGIDRQRECPPTLIPALVRLGEIVRLSHLLTYDL